MTVALLGACPPAGQPDGGPDADAGNATSDAGLAPLDAGEEPTDGGASDAGPGEGEGETCGDLSHLGTLVDDAGVLHYENCPDAFIYDNGCTLGECATNDNQLQVLEAALGIAAERGYQMEVWNLSGDVETSVRLDAVITVEWVKADFFVRGRFDESGSVEVSTLREDMPLYIPASVRSFESALEEIRGCEPEASPNLCGMWAKRPVLGGVPIGECGAANLELWNANWPDAGYDPLECHTELPCCFDAGAL